MKKSSHMSTSNARKISSVNNVKSHFIVIPTSSSFHAFNPPHSFPAKFPSPPPLSPPPSQWVGVTMCSKGKGKIGINLRSRSDLKGGSVRISPGNFSPSNHDNF